jgi:hypothetical protein
MADRKGGIIFSYKNVQKKYDKLPDELIDRSAESFQKRLLPLDKKLNQDIKEIPNIFDDKILTYGYIDYLTIAYENHFSIEIAPWHLWTIVLTEISSIINKQPDLYKKYFTTKKEREDIKIELNDNLFENIEEFLKIVRQKSPFDIELFRPIFKSKDVPDLFNLTCVVSIGESIKHYYTMWIMCCGFPQIEISGDIEDWEIAAKISSVIAEKFDGEKTDLGKYMLGVSAAFTKCMKNLNNEDFWNYFFRIENCSSGSPVWEISEGFLIREFLSGKNLVEKAINMARMPFKIQDNEGLRWSVIASGIMQGELDKEGFLRPIYNYARYDLLGANMEDLPDLDLDPSKKSFEETK